MDDEIEACLDDWREDDPELSGEVSMRFGVDANGLQEAWIEDHTDVPLGPLSCFGTAVAAIDWSGVTQEPVEISTRYAFDGDASR